ncbi:flagellar hook-length control protein FliK [Thiomonas sp.]
MNPAQILSGAASVNPAGSAGAARAEPTAFAAAPGTTFEAEVVQVQTAQPGAASLTAAADGRLQTQVLLRLGNALVSATLPGAAPQPGARLPLIYLGSRNGQPQFLLAPQQAAQTSAQSQLSGPGQLLGLLQQMQATASASSANPGVAGADARAATAAATPVWPNPAQPLQQAAQQLASALQQSGLFYESHLGAWAQGQQPLSALLTQPQGRLSPLLQTAAQTAATPQTAAATDDAAARGPGAGHGAQPGPAPTGAAAATLMTTPPAEAATAVRHAALAAYNAVQTGPQAASDPATLAARLPAELHGVVQQQLQTLMQGQIVWEGLLWPGQSARWSLRPDPEGHATPGPVAERAWSTQVELELPQLGPVQARLRLNGNRLDLWLRRSPQAQQRIDAALPQLRAALQSAGLEVARVQLGQTGAGEST